MDPGDVEAGDGRDGRGVAYDETVRKEGWIKAKVKPGEGRPSSKGRQGRTNTETRETG